MPEIIYDQPGNGRTASRSSFGGDPRGVAGRGGVARGGGTPGYSMSYGGGNQLQGMGTGSFGGAGGGNGMNPLLATMLSNSSLFNMLPGGSGAYGALMRQYGQGPAFQGQMQGTFNPGDAQRGVGPRSPLGGYAPGTGGGPKGNVDPNFRQGQGDPRLQIGRPGGGRIRQQGPGLQGGFPRYTEYGPDSIYAPGSQNTGINGGWDPETQTWGTERWRNANRGSGPRFIGGGGGQGIGDALGLPPGYQNPNRGVEPGGDRDFNGYDMFTGGGFKSPFQPGGPAPLPPNHPYANRVGQPPPMQPNQQPNPWTDFTQNMLPQLSGGQGASGLLNVPNQWRQQTGNPFIQNKIRQLGERIE